ncbi:unnamed protein product, partial [Urochloa humidicola]
DTAPPDTPSTADTPSAPIALASNSHGAEAVAAVAPSLHELLRRPDDEKHKIRLEKK